MERYTEKNVIGTNLIAAVYGYIEWHDNLRIKESLDWMSPAEYRRLLGSMKA